MVPGSLGHVISIGYDGRTSGGFIGTATCEGIGIPAPGGPVTSAKRARHRCYRASRMDSEELASLGEATGIRRIHSHFYEGPAGRKGERGVRKSSHHLTKHTPVGKTRSLRATFRAPENRQAVGYNAPLIWRTPPDRKPRHQMDFSHPWPKSASGLISSISKVIAA